MTINSALMNVMVGAARKAGRRLARDFAEVEDLQISVKGTADFVSKADHEAERVLFEELSRVRPGYGFLMEESGAHEGPDKTHRWIVDPLDGTTNFLHGIPHFAVSVALEREGQLIAGVVFNPITNDLYMAEKGRGAWINDKRLRVSARREPTMSVISTGIPFAGRPHHETSLNEMRALMPRIAGIRRFGAAALDLAYVAAGKYEGFWERGLSPWDIAAGIVLVREAGGIIEELNGGRDVLETGDILASNEGMLSFLRSTLKDANS